MKDKKIKANYDNHYPIILSSSFGHIDIVRLLLTYEEVNPSDRFNAAICYAAEKGFIDIVKLLLEDKRINMNLDGAIVLACTKGHFDIYDLFLKYKTIKTNRSGDHIWYITNNSKFKIRNEENVLKILWDCCQIPDFVKHTYGHHLEVVSKVFNFLISNKERIPNLYMREQIKNLDKLDGNVDTLTNRISNVRTWAYVSNKKNWVQNQDYWIERTKTIEDKLSDRLHEELTKSFIDRRASVLARGLKQDTVLETEIKNDKDVIIDGQYIGELKGLKLNLDFRTGALNTDIKSLKKAARKGISPELTKRVNLIISSGILKLNEDFRILWLDNPIAKIIPGKNYLEPNIDLITDDILDLDSKNKLIEFLK